MFQQQAVTYSCRLRESPAYIAIVSWLTAAAAHPWANALLNASRQAFAFLIGETYEDERVAFSKKRLTVNDSYRDRLLASEIADLVDLWDALAFSIAQRKAFFRCFLHLDYMRRAGVSRAELLRYCGLRETPATHHLLPSIGQFAVVASTHRRDGFRTQRWDVLQLLALMFSLCTMETRELVDLCVQEIIARSQANPEEHEGGGEGCVDEDGEQLRLSERLPRAIDTALAFSCGVPSPMENGLATFLRRLYRDRQHGKVEFARVHGVDSLAGVITLFPVLLFPCVWTQRVIKRRVMGESTWRKLALRRAEMQLMGAGAGFMSPSDIIAAAKTQQQLHTRQATRVGIDESVVNEANPSQGRSSTPRKVLPVENQDGIKEGGLSCVSFADFPNEDAAWRATADSVLATVYVCSQCEVVTQELTTADAAALFREMHQQVQARALPQRALMMIQRQLIRDYGYQFMAFIFKKSSINEISGDLVYAVEVKKDLRRASQRHQKADEGNPLVEDKAIYWKEYTDPMLKRVFYHNIRTGESRWEAPSTLLAKSRKKRKRSPAISPSIHRNFL